MTSFFHSPTYSFPLCHVYLPSPLQVAPPPTLVHVVVRIPLLLEPVLPIRDTYPVDTDKGFEVVHPPGSKHYRPI
ncbi:hypothetical protein VIGAN_07012700 [Vigna angularis var. angularis]|uniref:Uncharacterized protein n=1 Tax=Vigna angularis var. angularis TaxID=157739 RepID=A0A0S3SFA2_PHAAN|nr:hypothetical protein VIGAN_07012700 [Vigna angularis var. angularis]